jgi:gluconolactonase
MTVELQVRYEAFDDRFRTGRCMNGDAAFDLLFSGCRWAEGPIYVPAWRQLVWSDIPNDRMLRWDEATGAVSVFRERAGHPNGNTLDRQGRLVTCEQGNRRVTRTEHDGTVTVLADRWDGKRLNSPNDAAVKSDGAIYFSDPDFGICARTGRCRRARSSPRPGPVTARASTTSASTTPAVCGRRPWTTACTATTRTAH